MKDEPDPYICLCNAVKLSTIEQAITDGIDTLEGLQEHLEVGVNCGACIPDILKILKRMKDENT